MAVEITTVERWLRATLTGDLTLAALVGDRVFSTIAPRDAAHPLIVYSFQAGLDTIGVGTARIMSRPLFTIRVVAPSGSFADLEDAARRVDELLHGALDRPVAGSGLVLSCMREQPLALALMEEGTEYRQLGGIYRIDVQQEG